MQFDEEIQHYPFVLKIQNCGGKKCDVIGWCVVGNGMQIELGNETSSLDFGEVRNIPIGFESLNKTLGFVESKYFRFYVNDNQGRTYLFTAGAIDPPRRLRLTPASLKFNSSVAEI